MVIAKTEFNTNNDDVDLYAYIGKIKSDVGVYEQDIDGNQIAKNESIRTFVVLNLIVYGSEINDNINVVIRCDSGKPDINENKIIVDNDTKRYIEVESRANGGYIELYVKCKKYHAVIVQLLSDNGHWFDTNCYNCKFNRTLTGIPIQKVISLNFKNIFMGTRYNLLTEGQWQIDANSKKAIYRHSDGHVYDFMGNLII